MGVASAITLVPRLLQARSRELQALGAIGLIFIVVAPMLITRSGFAIDFTNHLWLTWVAGRDLSQLGRPSYFINTGTVGVFYPWFAFYGGTLYAVVGAASEVLGGRPIAAFIGVTTAVITATYFSLLSLGRQVGLRGWRAHAPAATVLTSAYYTTNLYGRGAWTEFMATAMIPPMLASGLHLLRGPRWQPWPVLVFIGSAVIFTGSHNITLLWGSTTLLLSAATVLTVTHRWRSIPIRRLVMICGLGLIALLINSWFLVPDILYASRVRAHLLAQSVAGASFFDTPGVLLNPLRGVPSESTTPALYVQIPVWFLVWAAAAIVLLRSWRFVALVWRVWVGLAVALALLLVALMLTPFWRVVPFPFNEIQFPYRLGSYIYYLVAGLVLVAALAVQKAPAQSRLPGERRMAVVNNQPMRRWLDVGLAIVAAVSIGLCVWQEWVPSPLFFESSYTNRASALRSTTESPRTWYDPGSYNDDTGPILNPAARRTFKIPPGRVHGDSLDAWLRVPAGTAPFESNIGAGSYLISISGLTVVGRSRNGYAVLRREHAGSGPVHVVIHTVHSTTLAGAWACSVAGLLAAFAVLAWSIVASFRLRRPKTSQGALPQET